MIVSLVSPDGERSMCPDRGVAIELRCQVSSMRAGSPAITSTSRATRSWRAPCRDAAIAAVGLARGHGARVSVDLSSWSVIRDVGPDALPRAPRERSRPTSCSRTPGESELVGGAIAGRPGSSSGEPTAAHSATTIASRSRSARGGRYDRRRRRAGGRLDRRWARARTRGRCTMRPAGGSDARRRVAQARRRKRHRAGTETALGGDTLGGTVDSGTPKGAPGGMWEAPAGRIDGERGGRRSRFASTTLRRWST